MKDEVLRRPLSIGFVTRRDVSIEPRGRQLGSVQASYAISRTLQELGCVLSFLGPLDPPYISMEESERPRFIGLDVPVITGYAHDIMSRLAIHKPDVVLSRDPVVLADVYCAQPLAVWTDARIGQVIREYPYMRDLDANSARALAEIEQRALEKCAAIIFSSEWAAAQAAVYLDRAKVHVVPFGANFKHVPSRTEVHSSIQARSPSPCRLLFLGTAWTRKRGAMTIEIASLLQKMGWPSEVTIVGVTEPHVEREAPSFVRFVHFLDKSNPDEERRLRQILEQSHFLILPSTKEMFGHVLPEANAFGVPCLASDTGGIPTVITNGMNGYLLPVESTAHDYAQRIAATIADYSTYQELARRARTEFESRLNWDVSCAKVVQILRRVCGTATPGLVTSCEGP